jgi:hypothetical protein
VYVWRKGALDWGVEKKTEATEARKTRKVA